jgi:hypothetical protein
MLCMSVVAPFDPTTAVVDVATLSKSCGLKEITGAVGPLDQAIQKVVG